MTRLQEIELITAETWLRAEIIFIVDQGEENTYYVDEFDNHFYCKTNH